MSWYDGILDSIGEAYDTASTAVGSVYDEYINATAEREREEIRDEVRQQQTSAPVPGGTISKVNSINWTMVGVVVSAIGVGYVIYKGAK